MKFMLNVVVAALFVVVSFLLPPSLCTASDHLQQYGNSALHQEQFIFPSLPRKLNLQEEAAVKKSLGNDEDLLVRKKLMEAPSGKKRHENMVVHHHDDQQTAGKGTWREWIESPKRSEYFTMDYAWVRRRRPIHNKKIPFLP
ncbi:hypothetical protein Salat_1948800 [Sesamum alatum]|uniref:Uncharacterized protein n=1 Tax=Sesamum alatum TaxID=300844 RepID=A0AAE1Y5E8_9LAMI|nr:hypothetical protein Salat_1948800 [Sesamum alatum]